MKHARTLLLIALFLVPFVACAQTNPNPSPPDPSQMPPGPAVAQQPQATTLPPPARMPMQRMHHGGPPGPPFGPPVLPGLGPGLGAWWKNSEIVSRLQLSEEQVRKIEQTFLDHKLKLIDLQADLEKQELRLQPLLDVDHPDEAKVGAQIDLITAARGKLEKENAMMMLAIRRELTIEQWKKLQAMREEHRAGAMGRRMEGPVPLPPGEFPKRPPEPTQQ
jgi:periplasmic protein CpxP/Spy